MYKKSHIWIRVVPLTGMLVALSTTAFAAAAGPAGIWDGMRDFFLEIGDLLYVVAAVGIVLGASWSCWRWHQTREFGEGIGGMVVIAVIAVFVFYVIPELIGTVPTMSGS